MTHCVSTYAHEDIMLQKLLPAGSVIFTKSSYSTPVNKTSCGLPYAYVVLQIAICNLEIMIFFFCVFLLINHQDDSLREFTNFVRNRTTVVAALGHNTVTTVSHQY